MEKSEIDAIAMQVGGGFAAWLVVELGGAGAGVVDHRGRLFQRAALLRG
jgi:hypothetical protein